jgi:hypothetical protein
MWEQRWSEARFLVQEVMKIRQSIDYRSGIAQVHERLGDIARCEGRYELAIEQY